MAEALLAKARSTTFDGERDSFVAGAYSQLGAFLGSGRPMPVATAALPPAPERPAQALPAGEGPDEAVDDEPVVIVDLAAAERAYRGLAWGSTRSGVLVDLTI